ncbi:type I secretion protein [Roseovarius mucosus]|uniref:type I secretion protein n=1 Tax=Roseovarius mucosus TaxID=215743 RepID=UPI001C5DC884|nr:type I secretion protein [Roseovarius mucosus]MBW4973389.1 type I secretion protein [Roseovarius mucosus]
MPFILSIEDVGGPSFTAAHFGGNLLATRDVVGANGTFADTAATLGMAHLRYPGGALTENCACIYEADRLSDPPRTTDEPVQTSVTEMFSYATQAGIALTLVLPTRDFLTDISDENGHRFADVDEAAVRQFIADIAEGNFGTAPVIQAFEIGNEYWGSGEMNTVEYGRLASEMALIVEDEMSRHPASPQFADTDILVQMGTNHGVSDLSGLFDGTGSEQLAAANQMFGLSLSEEGYIYSSGEVAWSKVNNAILMDQFDTDAERAAVDGIVAHIYSRGEDVPGSRYFELSQIGDTWLEEMPDLKVYATEWNLKRTVGDTREEEFGLKQAHEMLNIVEAFHWGGVDAAHAWALQLNSRTALAEVEGDAEMRVAGEMFRLMNEVLPGTRPLALVGSAGRETELQGTTADVHSFYAQDRLVTFIASTSDGQSEQVVDFNNLVTQSGEVSITRLGVAEGENPTFTSAEPQITHEDASALLADGILIADLAPREILMIEMSNPTYTDAVREIAAQDVPDDDPVLPMLPPEAPPQDQNNPPDQQAEDEGKDDGGFVSTLLGVLPLLFFAG